MTKALAALSFEYQGFLGLSSFSHPSHPSHSISPLRPKAVLPGAAALRHGEAEQLEIKPSDSTWSVLSPAETDNSKQVSLLRCLWAETT